MRRKLLAIVGAVGLLVAMVVGAQSASATTFTNYSSPDSQYTVPAAYYDSTVYQTYAKQTGCNDTAGWGTIDDDLPVTCFRYGAGTTPGSVIPANASSHISYARDSGGGGVCTSGDYEDSFYNSGTGGYDHVNELDYDLGEFQWQTGIVSGHAAKLVFQGDGNLVLYKTTNSWSTSTVAWQSHTSQTGTNYSGMLDLQADGNVVIYRVASVAHGACSGSDGTVLWSAGSQTSPVTTSRVWVNYLGSWGTDAIQAPATYCCTAANNHSGSGGQTWLRYTTLP